jgi:hypothetical protein
MVPPPIKDPPINDKDDDDFNDKHTASTGNAYLALREANIARNEARLRELGLIKEQHVSAPPAKKSRISTRNTAATTTDAAVATSPPRRSGRLKQQPPEHPPLEEDPTIQEDRPTIRKKKRTKSNNNHDQSNQKPAPQVPPKANSVRAISIDVKRLVLGTADTQGVLGIPMEQTGKEFVVYEAFRRSACDKIQQELLGNRLSFNKYSGVQEWGSGVLFLWVNIGNNDSVVNDFINGGKQITWFGGSRMHDESPVILNLIRIGQQQAASQTSTLSASSGIVLWCRRYQSKTKKFGSYVCLGRLAYHSHLPSSSPLSFVWNLLDHDKLQNHPDKVAREGFQEMVSL